MTRWTVELINVVSTHRGGAEVKGGMGGREPHCLPREPSRGSPSLGGNNSDGQSE